MLVGYFDDSGSHSDSAAVTMAGYLALTGNWTIFEDAAEIFLEQVGVRQFHAVELFHRHGEFKNWSRPDQFTFCNGLLTVARDAGVACGCTYSIHKGDYNKMRKALPSTSPYAACLYIVLQKLLKNAALWELVSKHGLALVLEAGNANNANVIEVFDRVRRDNPEIADRLVSVSEAKKSSCRAIQLADYLAYFSWRLADKAARNRHWDACPFLKIASTNVPTMGDLVEKFSINPDY